MGDRPDCEITQANRLGRVTCRVCYGEFQHLEARAPHEKADSEIQGISGLQKACSL